VLLDIDIPVMDGFAVLEALKEAPKTFHVPVVMLTVQSGEDYKVAASRLYCEEYSLNEHSYYRLRFRSLFKRFGTQPMRSPLQRHCCCCTWWERVPELLMKLVLPE
jgi:CheY-like chemotaxis protein